MTNEAKFLSITEASKRLGVCRATIYNWSASGWFPPIKQLGPNRVAILESDLNVWMQGRQPSSRCKTDAA